LEGSWSQFEEGTTALIPEENVLMDTENAWISVQQLSAGFGTMLTSGVESIPDQAGWALNAHSLHSKAGAHFRRRHSQRPDKTMVFKPATFCGFRNDADSGARFQARHPLNLAKRLFSNRQLSVGFGMLPRVWSPTGSHPRAPRTTLRPQGCGTTPARPGSDQPRRPSPSRTRKRRWLRSRIPVKGPPCETTA